MTAPLLYTYRRCPYAMRARMALLIAGIPFAAMEVSLRDKPPAMLAISPKGTVPVLHLPSGEVLAQSWDIMRWAMAQQGLAQKSAQAKQWWEKAQTAENLAWLVKNDGLFKHHLDRYKYPQRYADEDPISHRDQACAEFLLPLENCLQRSVFLGGDSPCATDIALFPFVRQFAAVAPDWFKQAPMLAVKSWLSFWLASPLFEHCMRRLPSQTICVFPAYAGASSGLDKLFNIG
jgi:glutathione S-transferase